jgi:general secretion pathway protein A
MTHDKKLLALFGLKWNPFTSNIPVESLWTPPAFEPFFFRVENLVMEGGFAMICAQPGLGKSKILQLISHRRFQSPQRTLVASYQDHTL